ncbi:hypothetical protein [Amycolatopsis sp. CA-230715]|uniref:hypothetical protein n=1 Tax=Amycolatopsis sp. CA-230715 TaxID=2745196 RepID=UPI001C0303DC|nr:hypothetical protein [Amycolatopsis sp. CA-230715]QWF81701.1 hypothetical protein HUW46_05134 [Amycolatopsis sp. CA-230715]
MFFPDEADVLATTLGQVREQQFAGQPVVSVSPVMWRLDPSAIRLLAWAEGYAEAPPEHPDVLTFHCVRQRYTDDPQWTYPPGYVFEPAERAGEKDRNRLRARLAKEPRCWVSLRDARLRSETVAKIAAERGMRIAAKLGDDTDQVLLLAGATDSNPLAVARRTGLGSITHPMWLTIAGLLIGLGFGGAVLVGLSTGNQVLAFVLGFGVAAIVVGAVSLTRLLPRSTRTALMISHFSGDTVVELDRRLYDVSNLLCAQAATLHGYRFVRQRTYRRAVTLVFQRVR